MNLSVLIPWGGDVADLWRARSFAWVMERYQNVLPDAEVVVGTSEQGQFNRSEARNHAFEQSSKDFLLVADADTLFHAEQIYHGLELLDQGAPWVIPYGIGRYYNLSQGATERMLGLDPSSHIPEPSDPNEWEFALESWAGLLILSRAAWEKVGGYCTEFIGWGAEDNAFRHALDRRVGPFQRTPHWVGHLWHPRKDADFDQPNWSHNARLLDEFRRGIR